MLEINMNHTLFYYISENKISDKVYMDNSLDIQKPIEKVVIDIKQLKIDIELIREDISYIKSVMEVKDDYSARSYWSKIFSN